MSCPSKALSLLRLPHQGLLASSQLLPLPTEKVAWLAPADQENVQRHALISLSAAPQEEAQVHKYINQLREAGGAFDHITSTK